MFNYEEMKNKIILADCMDIMKDIPDKYFELAIVDPPYGLNAGNWNSFGIRRGKYSFAKAKAYMRKRWDDNPANKEYFDEVFRVSKHQIIWGVNYFFHERLQGGRIFWDKDTPEGFIKSRGELAYQSFTNIVEYFKFRWNGMFQEDMKNKEIRIHPTQKPVRLYEWLLGKYVKKNWIVLDTHVGSQSIRIACHNGWLYVFGFATHILSFKAQKPIGKTDIYNLLYAGRII